MTPPHLIHQMHSSFFETSWLHSTKTWQTIRIHWQCSHWGGWSLFKMHEWVKYNATDMGATQNNSILPGLKRLPISQDRTWQNEACPPQDRYKRIAKRKEHTGWFDFYNHYSVHQPCHEANSEQTWQKSLPIHYIQCQHGWVPNKKIMSLLANFQKTYISSSLLSVGPAS